MCIVKLVMKGDYFMLQVFMIWQNGKKSEEQILNDIKIKYDIIQVFDVLWNQKEFAHNLSRFYGKRLPAWCKKERECGTGAFVLIVCDDKNPDLVDDARHLGEKSNANAIRDKAMYRKWTGGGYLVHASDNASETNENLLFLLGITSDEFCAKYTNLWNGEKIYLSQKMIGEDGWKNVHELKGLVAKILNTNVDVIDNALTITTNNVALVARLLNLKKSFSLFKKNKYNILINEKKTDVLLKATV